MLAIDRLQVRYGKQTALALVERPLVIGAGDRIGVIGSSSAGKLRFLKAVLGLVPYRPASARGCVRKTFPCICSKIVMSARCLAKDYIMSAIPYTV